MRIIGMLCLVAIHLLSPAAYAQEQGQPTRLPPSAAYADAFEAGVLTEAFLMDSAGILGSGAAADAIVHGLPAWPQLPPLPDSVATQMISALRTVVHYVLIDRDSLPEVSQPSAKGLLRRTGGRVALVVGYRSAPPSLGYDYTHLRTRLGGIARSVVADANIGTVKLLPGEVVPTQFADGPIRRVTGHRVTSTQLQILASCADRILQPPLPGDVPRMLVSECQLYQDIGFLLRLSYPIPIADSVYEVRVNLKTDARGPASTGHNFTVILVRQDGMWSATRVVPSLLR